MALPAALRRSNRVHRNIPSVRVPVKSQRKPLLGSVGSLFGRNRPARGWRDGFFGGLWVYLQKAGNGGARSPARAALPRHPLVVLVLRRGLGVGIGPTSAAMASCVKPSCHAGGPRACAIRGEAAGLPLPSIATIRGEGRLSAQEGALSRPRRLSVPGRQETPASGSDRARP